MPQGASLAAAAERLERRRDRVVRPLPPPGARLRRRGIDQGRRVRAARPRQRVRHPVDPAIGKVFQRVVVVPEGLPSIMVRDLLMKADTPTGDVDTPREGAVLPDGYAFERGEARTAVLARMEAAMTRYLAEAWKRRKATTIAKTPEQAIILASIVEKETGKPSVAHRRRGLFQSPAPRHAVPGRSDRHLSHHQGRPLGRRIRQSELRVKNGYNTYASAGLPVGPIANPGRPSIDAVLDPAQTRALYFVADGTGGHVFADTLEQHNANVKKWYAIRRARGEM
ncbi:endolytic transglycosylase MltG [Sphingomonas sp. MMS24-JH45]